MSNKKGKLDNIQGKGFDAHPEHINKKGRPIKLPALDVLLAEVMGETQNGLTAAKAVLLALRKKAMAGDSRCAELLMDRAYGKTKSTDPPPVINVNMPSITIKYRNE